MEQQNTTQTTQETTQEVITEQPTAQETTMEQNQETQETSEKQTVPDWLASFRYKNSFTVGSCGIGSLTHRLCRLMYDVENKRHGEEFDSPDMFNHVKKLISSVESLYFVGEDNTTEVELADYVLQDRRKKTESWQNWFTLDARNLKSNDQVKLFLVSLVSALKERVDFMSNVKFGKKGTKEVTKVNEKTKKKQTRNEPFDNRSYRGKLSSGLLTAFSLLDEVEKSCNTLHTQLVSRYSNLVAKFEQKQQSKATQKKQTNGKKQYKPKQNYKGGKDQGDKPQNKKQYKPKSQKKEVVINVSE
jgi:hypothetical protein